MEEEQIRHLLEHLYNEQCGLDLAAFEKIFEDDIAEHFWRQYSTTYKHNLLSFFGYLNGIERTHLITYIKTVIDNSEVH